jgi:NAD(P)-dependent dehydrogenase (short-subunit alcohol dehydrogenase family)
MKRDSQVVVITGASAGIGRATANAFAERGAKLGLLARGEVGLAGAVRDVERAGGTALAMQADVADPEAVERAAARVEAELGPIDIWINNAMVSVFSPVEQMTPDEFRRVTEVTYLGVVHGTLAALKRMAARKRGTIVQVGSALAYRSIPLQSAYCAAKHAIVGFTDSLRSELLHDKSPILLTMVHPPASNTPQFQWVKTRLPKAPQPVPPLYAPEVTARAIVWAVDHHRRELWIGAPTYGAIVGQKLAPTLLDHYLGAKGYEAQQIEGSPPQRDNLWAPVDDTRDFGAAGAFGDKARQHSLALWATEYRSWVALAGTLVVAGAIAVLAGARR